MIENDNLRTASLYINNQLLSRGLLRDGHNIDFADPDAGSGLPDTMGKIMGVVNDLILRRDRDAAHRESLSSTLLSLRADAQRNSTEHTRLSEKLVDAQRKLDGAEATERALRQQLKAAESTAHKLKDEMAKMKALVAQSRAACAHEVRKRDRQIDALKKAVVDAGRVRGGARARDVVTISVVGDTGAEARADGVARGGTSAEGYSLRMETNEFLTELAKGLSEENSLLLSLVRRTVDSLREMGGLERPGADADDAPRRSGNAAPPPQGSADELADELEGIMEHLRTILTNPSFVPIEEVEIREVEIARLREGWERMEARWKDAVRMMDSWRRRIASSGKPVDMEELQMGMRMSPVRVKDEPDTARDQDLYRQELSCVQEEEEEEEEQEEEQEEDEDEDEDEVCQLEPRKSRGLADSLELVPAQHYENGEEDDYSDESSLFQDNVDVDDLEGEEPNVEILQVSTDANMKSPPMPVPPQLSPLKDSYSFGNRRPDGHDSSRKRPVDSTTNTDEKNWEFAAATGDVPPRPPPHAARPVTSQKNTKPTPDGRPASTISHDSTLFGESYESPIRSNPNRKLFSKPSPVPSPDLQQPAAHEGQSEPAAKARKTRKADDIASATATSPELKPTMTTRRTRSASKRIVSAPTIPSGKKARSAVLERLTASRPPPTTVNDKNINNNKNNNSNNNNNNDSSSNSTASSSRNPQPSPHGRTPSASSRLPTRRSQQAAVQESPITMATIAAKLAASEREADAARVRAKLRAARMSRTRANAPNSPAVVPPTPPPASSGPAAPAVSPLPNASVDPVKRDVSPLPPRLLSSHPACTAHSPSPAAAEKGERDEDEDELVYAGKSPERSAGSAANTPRHRRTTAVDRGSGRPEKRKRERRPSKVVSRRRSTLSPWELESLIQGNVEVESPAR